MDQEPINPTESKINPIDFFDATKKLVPFIESKVVVSYGENIVPMHYLIENINEQNKDIQVLGFNPDKKKTLENKLEFQILPGHNFTHSLEDIEKFKPDTVISFFEIPQEITETSANKFIFIGKKEEISTNNHSQKTLESKFKLTQEEFFVKTPNDKSGLKMFVFEKK
jgi:hypothetical protein